MNKNTVKLDRVVPRILWSNQAYYRYTGPVAKGFVEGEGYISQALRITYSPAGFLDIDIEKAANILRATRNPTLMECAKRCTQVLVARQSKDGSL